MKILYISWDGPYVSYLDGLFLPILARLKASGFEFHILHFSWAEEQAIGRIRNACHAAGVPYRHVKIRSMPSLLLGKLWATLSGPDEVVRYIRAHNITCIMARTLMPARMTLRVMKRIRGLTVVYDADGLPIEERVDFTGLKPGGWRHRELKRIERGIIQHAARILTRTDKAIAFLASQYGPRPGFFKVLNGRDENLFAISDADFKEKKRIELGIPLDALLVVYNGSLGAPYCVDEMISLQRHIVGLAPTAWWLVLTGNPNYFGSQLPIPRMTVLRVAPAEVPSFLSLAEIGFALRKPAPSMQGVSPIKLGEYLLCGIPVIATASIGDTEEILSNKPYSFLLRDLSDESLRAAAAWAVTNPIRNNQEAERRDGVSYFGLENAVASYLAALNGLSLSPGESGTRNDSL